MEKAGSSVVRQLRFVVASWKEDTRTDVELLSRFVQTRDEQAFSTLVGRHSELVWGVCLRVLRNQADAEDALQATFLRLARDARRILNREALGAWLFRVARDCAIDLQRSIARQRRIEERVAEVATRAGSPDVPSDLRVLLDDELAQLPRSESAVLILCCLEGRTYADAALELGCSTAAVHRRFVRAQTRLRRKFTKHGPAAVGVLAAVLSGAALPAASAAPVAALANVVETGLAVARSGVVPTTRAGLLIGSAPRAAGRAGLAAAVAAVVLAAGALAALVAGSRTDPKPIQTAREDAPTAPEPAKSATTLTGTVRGPNGEPVAGATVAVLARRPFGPGERGLRDELLATVAADGDGGFTLPVPDDFDTWFAGRVVTVQASGPNLAPATVAVRLRPAPAAVELTLKLAVALRGQLVDEAGRPAPGVRLEIVRVGDAVAEPVVGRIEQAPPAWPLPVVSAADGTFAVPVLGGSANVWARVNDARFALDTFRLDVAGPARYSLAPARPLVVEVRTADTDAPLPGARVTVITDRVSAHPHFCATDHGVLSARSVPSDIDALTNARGQARVNLAPDDLAEVLVHAPTNVGPYIGVRVEYAAGSASDGRLVVRLPRGVWASGTVTNASGQPLPGAAVHWGREAAALPEWKDEFLVGRDALTRTGPDGGFKLAVLPGACSIRVYGPTSDYEPASAKLPGTNQSTIYAHHIAALNVPPSGDVPPPRIALRGAPAVSGTVERHAAESGTAFVLCSGRVSAVRGYAALPLPVRDGAFSIPGCRAGHTSRAYLLDPVAKLGAVVDMTLGAPVPQAKWLACGALRVRVIDADGKPQANQDVHLALLAARDRAAGSADEPATDAQPVEWFDATNYPSRPKTDAQGVVELPAMVPGARYSLAVGTGAGRVAVGKFLIESGKVQTLPDVVLPRRVEGGSQ